jgi:hypothetical protein
MSNFQVEALPVEPFEGLFSLSDEALADLHIRRLTADAKPGYPCRVSLEDAEVGESVLLLKFDHLKAGGFYDGSGPIFVRKDAETQRLDQGVLPLVVTAERLFSVRAYDQSAWMVRAQVVSGAGLKEELHAAFEDPQVNFIDVHNARPGCFAFRVRRAES